MPWCCGASAESSTPPITAAVSDFGDQHPLVGACRSGQLGAAASNASSSGNGLWTKKTALLVSPVNAEGVFLDRLRNFGWTIETVEPSAAEASISRLRPYLVLLDYRINDLISIAKSIRSVCEEDELPLMTVISDRSLTEKKRRSLGKASIVHFVSWNSREISLVEYVSRMAAKLRILPALFSALEEVSDRNEQFDNERNKVVEIEEAIQVNDESKTVTYVNKAWERKTGLPRSQVLALLREASTLCEGQDASKYIRDAVKLLSSHEIYAPSITRFRDGDRVAAQYYDGLIRVHPERRRISGEVRGALENDHAWSYDVLQLERVSEHHALSQLGLKIFNRWRVCEMLSCTEDTLTRWLLAIEAHYHPGNAYHNATHAADVLQATSHFLEAQPVAAHVVENHAVASLIAATVHDLDHPGRGNAFLINTRQSLSVLYNDLSVLENHHVALAFQITLQPSNNMNILAALSREEFATMRSCIIEMVLATDIRRHFEYVTKFRELDLTSGDAEQYREAHSITICNMLLKCADISNPAREWSLCERWAHRIVQEYFEQTIEEKEKGLPVTMAFFDKDSCNVPLTQVGFIEMFALDSFTSWTTFAKLPNVMGQLMQNLERWQAMADRWTPAENNALLS